MATEKADRIRERIAARYERAVTPADRVAIAKDYVLAVARAAERTDPDGVARNLDRVAQELIRNGDRIAREVRS